MVKQKKGAKSLGERCRRHPPWWSWRKYATINTGARCVSSTIHRKFRRKHTVHAPSKELPAIIFCGIFLRNFPAGFLPADISSRIACSLFFPAYLFFLQILFCGIFGELFSQVSWGKLLQKFISEGLNRFLFCFVFVLSLWSSSRHSGGSAPCGSRRGGHSFHLPRVDAANPSLVIPLH